MARLLINGVSLLETELSNRQTHHVLVINFQAPPGQKIERCHRPRDAGAEVGPHAMAHFLTMEDRGEHRQHRFHQHPRIPGATRTDFHIDGIPGLRMEPGIGQDDHRVGKLGNQRLKMRIVDVGGGAIPRTDQTPLVQDKTKFPTDNPSMITLAFLANLGRAASFPHGMDQLDPIGVRHSQHGGGGQKPGGPRRVRLEEPGQAGALRHLGKQRPVVARQPAIESPRPAAFDGIQQGQRHDFTGVEFGVRVFGNIQHLLVYRVEQCDNKIWGRHRTGSSWLKFAQPQLEPVCDYLSTRTSDITYQTNTIGYYFEPLKDYKAFRYVERRENPDDEYFTTSFSAYILPVIPEKTKSLDGLEKMVVNW